VWRPDLPRTCSRFHSLRVCINFCTPPIILYKDLDCERRSGQRSSFRYRAAQHKLRNNPLQTILELRRERGFGKLSSDTRVETTDAGGLPAKLGRASEAQARPDAMCSASRDSYANRRGSRYDGVVNQPVEDAIGGGLLLSAPFKPPSGAGRIGKRCATRQVLIPRCECRDTPK
jgi:hypothetical protein